ncbi:MAG: hypothetical protein JSR21_12930 [Proteobacteria bacterium]|nr:hypothetical protein [Pseudomonadota bacterium]
MTRWTVSVSKQTDRRVRTFLAERGMKKGDLSKFIEDAVRRRVLEQTIEQARGGFDDMAASDAEALIDDAVAWARQEKRRKRA